MKVAILTSSNQWFIPFAKSMQKMIEGSYLFYTHQDIGEEFDIVFILSYHKIIEKKYLKKHKHNIVIHASNLPEGKGWAPMFWQVLEGKNEIVFSMFEASSGMDDGDIYMKKTLKLEGYELHDELRNKQANFIINMCISFLDNYEFYKIPTKQEGKESFYAKRTQEDSELDIDKTIREQINLLRIVSNEEYPAFFRINGRKYIIKIEELKDENI
jgi:methionyl-tRNA formyltransferase